VLKKKKEKKVRNKNEEKEEEKKSIASSRPHEDPVAVSPFTNTALISLT